MSILAGITGLVNAIAPVGIQALQLGAQADVAAAQAQQAQALQTQVLAANAQAADRNQFNLIFLGTAGLIALALFVKNR